MYKFIEEIYKKKSPYNRIKKWTLIIYLMFVIISLIFNFYSKIIPLIFVFILTIFTIKKACEIILKEKLHINFIKKVNDEDTLPYIIRNKELEMFKKYAIENCFYNEKSLLCIIEHYRKLIKPKAINGNLLMILSTIIPIVVPFYTKDGFDIKGLIYLTFFIIIVLFIYFLYRQIIETKKFIKGEDGMVERLEEIFSELYIECVNDLKENKKEKKKNKKQVNKKVKSAKKN